MTPTGRDLALWKLNEAKPNMASVRYRCLLPVLADPRLYSRSVISAATKQWRHLDRAGALILVKTFRKSDVVLAREANAAGVPVFFDLCDDIYADGYGGQQGAEIRRHFEQIASLAKAVVTTGPVLKKALCQSAGLAADRVQIQIDPFETLELTTAAINPTCWPNRSNEQELIRASGGVRAMASKLRGHLRRPTVAAPVASVGDATSLPQLLWFGTAGNVHSGQGLGALAERLPDLQRAFAKTPFHLHVVSNNADLYQALIPGHGIPSSFETWTPLGIFKALGNSRLALLPAAADAFSQSKSANRLALALAHSVPVVASDMPAYRPFADCIMLGDFASGIVRYLSDASLCRRHLDEFRERHLGDYSPLRSAESWLRRLGLI
jgi:hypothetical protein